MSLSSFDEKNKLCAYGHCDKCFWETDSESNDGTRIFLLDQLEIETNNSDEKDLQPIACYNLDDSSNNPLGGDEFWNRIMTNDIVTMNIDWFSY